MSMPTGDSPAIARRRVRLALREATGLTQAQVVEGMEWSLSKFNRIETAEVSVSLTDSRVPRPFVGVTDRDVVAQLSKDACVHWFDLLQTPRTWRR
jgi:hypothetical protein